MQLDFAKLNSAITSSVSQVEYQIEQNTVVEMIKQTDFHINGKPTTSISDTAEMSIKAFEFPDETNYHAVTVPFPVIQNWLSRLSVLTLCA